MANNITNVITIHADDHRVYEILDKIKADEIGIGSIDFNKIIPIPDNLDISKDAAAQKALAYYRACMQECAESLMAGKSPALVEDDMRINRSNQPEMWKLGKECYNNIRKYGTGNEEHFNHKLWGSKWNSYGYTKLPKYEDGSNSIRFYSAWSSVPKIMEKLSQMYPDVEFIYQWADDNFGHNVGEAKYKNGERLEEHIPANKTIEAYELAIDIREMDVEGADAEWMLSADGSTYVCMDNDNFELVYIQGKPMMWSKDCLTNADIPQGMYLYELDMIKGSVVSNEPLDPAEVDDDNYIILDEPDEDLNFTDEYISLKDYRNHNFDTGQSMGMNM